MPRAARTFLIVVVLGVVGLLALTWLARRYADLKPEASVDDVIPRADASALTDVDRFLDVRRVLKQVIAEDPREAKQLAAQLAQGDPGQTKPVQFNLMFLMKFRVAREQAALDAGTTPERYGAIRAGYESWKRGESPAEPALQGAFDAKRSALAAADLGDLEILDRLVGAGPPN